MRLFLFIIKKTKHHINNLFVFNYQKLNVNLSNLILII